MPQVMSEKGAVKFVLSEPDRWKKDFRRLLVNGPPLHGKTESMKTMPAPRHILIVPGELGHSTIIEDEDTKKYFWEINKPIDQATAQRFVAEFNQTLTEILKQERVVTLGCDGLHVLYQLCLLKLGWPNDEANFGTSAYGRGHGFARAEFVNLVRRMTMSKAEYFIATCYDGAEQAEPGSKKMVMYPDFPGQMAKGVMGLFPAVFHAEKVSDGTVTHYKWRLQALGDVQGVGMHLPKEIREKFPAVVPADWKEIEKYIDMAAQSMSKTM